jgi:hypothetical protein
MTEVALSTIHSLKSYPFSCVWHNSAAADYIKPKSLRATKAAAMGR